MIEIKNWFLGEVCSYR